MTKTSYTKAEYDDLMSRIRKHFPSLCFLANLDSGAIAGPVINPDDTVEKISILWDDRDVAHEILGICGCGNSDSIAKLFLSALWAIKDYWEVPEDTEEKKDGDEWAQYIRKTLALFKHQNDTVLKDMIGVVNSKSINPTKFKFCENATLELLVLYDLDKMGWTDHNTSVYTSKLTEEGETALEILELLYAEGEKKEEI